MRDSWPAKAPTTDTAARIAKTVEEHGPGLLKTARYLSRCEEDALDAYQQTMETFIRHAPRIDPDGERAWLRAVLRNEVIATHRRALPTVDISELDEPAQTAPVEDQVIAREQRSRHRRLLEQLTRDQRTTLGLIASGYSYNEIAKSHGWTYTKVNRCATTGRKRLRNPVVNGL